MIKNLRIFALGAVALALIVASAAAWAAMKSDEATHDGTVVSISGDTLVMANSEGKQHTHTLPADVKLTLDGKDCKAADLKAGMKIRVTTNDIHKQIALKVEGIDKNRAFANKHHDGKFVSVSGNKLAMTDLKGLNEHTCTLAEDVKITCDGATCKSSDLKPGMKIRVTLENDESHEAIRIEAIDKNPAFTSL